MSKLRFNITMTLDGFVAGPVARAAALAGGLDNPNVNYELEEQRS
jgi:hypothetical protein